MAFDPWVLAVLAGTILFNVSLIPQLVRTLQLKRADHISALFTVLILVASLCMMAYMFHIREWVAASGYVGNLIVWSIVLHYRLNPSDAGRQPKG